MKKLHVVLVVIFSTLFFIFLVMMLKQGTPPGHLNWSSASTVATPIVDTMSPVSETASEKVRSVCVLISDELTCEIENLIQFATRSLGSKRFVHFKMVGKDTTEEQVVCHSLDNDRSVFEKTDYFVAHVGRNSLLSNYKSVLKKLGIHFAKTRVVQYLGGDERAGYMDPKFYTSFDVTFRNYWNYKLRDLNETLGTLHYIPIFTCYAYISLTSFPVIPSNVMKNATLIDQMADIYYHKLLPSSHRPSFCFFKGNGQRPHFKTLTKLTVKDRKSGQLVSKAICDLQFTEGFNKGSKTEYSLQQMNNAVSLCPGGTTPETFRMWEALDNGAIPIAQNVEYLSGIPKGHPLHILDVVYWGYGDSKVLHGILVDYYNNPLKMDQDQKKMYKWWFHYKVELMKSLCRALRVE